MTRRTSRPFSKQERVELWKRWHRGESLPAIARALDRQSGTVQSYFARYGGIEPTPRKRRKGHLTPQERETISRRLAEQWSFHQIAAELGRTPSTVSREVKRNGGREAYRAVAAEASALESARRPKTCKLAREPKLRRLVANKLRKNWSPGQISGWLRARFSASSRMYVSHETIYRTLLGIGSSGQQFARPGLRAGRHDVNYRQSVLHV